MAQGDDALERGAHREAAAYYHALLNERGLSRALRRRWERRPEYVRYSPEFKGKLSPTEEDAVKEKLRQALAGVWAPVLQEARDLFDEGFTVLALQLVAPLCEPSYSFKLEGEVVPGSCGLVEQVAERLEREASGGETPSFTRSAQIRGAIVKWAFPFGRSPSLAGPLGAQVSKNARQALKKGFPTHAWAWLRGYTLALRLEPSEKTGRFDIRKQHRENDEKRLKRLFNDAVSKAGTYHQEQSKAVQGARPWLAQVHAAVAAQVAPWSQSRRYGDLPGGLAMTPGRVTGACVAEARRALSRNDSGAQVTLDLQIEDCKRSKLSRNRPRQKTESYTVESGGWVRDPVHRYETKESCKKVEVCRNVRVSEKYWLPWKTCARKDIVVERRCKPVRVRVGTDWGPRRRVTRRNKKYRTVTVQEAYAVYLWTFKARVTARVGDRQLSYRVDVTKEGRDRKSTGYAGCTEALQTLASSEGKLPQLVLAQSPRDGLDGLARRLVKGEALDGAEYAELAEGTQVPEWVLAEAMAGNAQDPAVPLHASALAAAPRKTDWKARFGEAPPPEEGAEKPRKKKPTLLGRLRQQELDLLPDLRWWDVVRARHRPDLSLPKED